MAEIVGKFEEPGAEKEEGLTPAEEERRKARGLEVVDLVAKVSFQSFWYRFSAGPGGSADGVSRSCSQMNECGAPPKEIMGELPPGMDLGADGVPKLPEDCCIM